MNKLSSNSASGLRTEINSFLYLAFPLILTNFGTQLLDTVDTIIIGRVGTVELGAIGLGSEIYYGLAYFGMGVIYGFDPLVTQAVGAKDKNIASRLLWQSFYLAIVIAVIVILIGFLVQPTLPSLGIPTDIANFSNLYLSIRVFDLFPFFLMIAGRIYLQAYEYVNALIIGIVTANIINLPLTWILVFGDTALESIGISGIGLPPLGIEGAALGSVIVMFIQAAIVLFAVFKLGNKLNIVTKLQTPGKEIILASKLGVAVGLQVVCEVSIFLVMRFLMASNGAQWAAAHEVGMTYFNFTGTLAIGIGAAVSVQVGLSVGRKDLQALKRVVLLATLMTLSVISLYSVAMLMFPTQFSRIVTDQNEVIVIAPSILAIVAICTIADCHVQIMLGALRGMGDTKWPLFVQILLFFILGLPISLILVSVLDLSINFLWFGPTIAFISSSVLLSVRFYRKTRNLVDRLVV